MAAALSSTVAPSVNLTKLLDSDTRLGIRKITLQNMSHIECPGIIKVLPSTETQKTIDCSLFLYKEPSAEAEKPIGFLQTRLEADKPFTIIQITFEGSEEEGILPQKIGQALLQQILLIREMWQKLIEGPEEIEVRASINAKAPFWSGLGFTIREESTLPPQPLMYMSSEAIHSWRKKPENAALLENFPNNLQPPPPALPPPILKPETPPPVIEPAPVETPVVKTPRPPRIRHRKTQPSFLQTGFDILKALVWDLPKFCLGLLGSVIGSFFDFIKSLVK